MPASPISNTHCEQWPVIWLDCTGLANIELISEIGRIFSLHPLALEDVVNTGQRPKVDFFEDHAFVVVSDDRRRHAQPLRADRRLLRQEFRRHLPGARRAIRSTRCASASRPAAPTACARASADYLAYALIDAIVDSYFPPVEAIGDRIDGIEDEMLAHAAEASGAASASIAARRHVLKGALFPVRDALAA